MITEDLWTRVRLFWYNCSSTFRGRGCYKPVIGVIYSEPYAEIMILDFIRNWVHKCYLTLILSFFHRWKEFPILKCVVQWPLNSVFFVAASGSKGQECWPRPEGSSTFGLKGRRCWWTRFKSLQNVFASAYYIKYSDFRKWWFSWPYLSLFKRLFCNNHLHNNTSWHEQASKFLCKSVEPIKSLMSNNAWFYRNF